MARRYLDQRLKLQMLRVVATIETSGSILKAAAALGVSQPALTKTLQELEDIVQLRLFDWHSRGVRVTDAGRQLVRTARTILAEIARLDEQLDLLSTPGGGSVAVGALPVAAAGLLPGVLARLKAQHPRTQVRLQQGRTEDLLPLLAAGDLDMIVGRLYAPLVPDGFLREPLWSEPISLLARSDHPIFGAGEVTVAEIERYGLVLPTVTQRVGQEIEHALSLLGLTSAQSLRSNSYGFIREMMHDTDILSIMPRLLMVGDLLRGALRVVPLPVSTPERPAGLILHRDREILPAGAASSRFCGATWTRSRGRGCSRRAAWSEPTPSPDQEKGVDGRCRTSNLGQVLDAFLPDGISGVASVCGTVVVDRGRSEPAPRLRRWS